MVSARYPGRWLLAQDYNTEHSSYSQRYIPMYIFIIGTYINGLAWFVGRGSVSILMDLSFFRNSLLDSLLLSQPLESKIPHMDPVWKEDCVTIFIFWQARFCASPSFLTASGHSLNGEMYGSILYLGCQLLIYMPLPFIPPYLLYLHHSSFSFSNKLFVKTWLNSLHGQEHKLI